MLALGKKDSLDDLKKAPQALRNFLLGSATSHLPPAKEVSNMKKLMDILPVLLVVLFLTSGCAPVISKGIREQVDKEIRFEDVIQDPEGYEGKMVLWGGVIIGAKNLKEGTLIEVLRTATDRQGRPKNIDRSEGRFLALYDGYLDVAIYAQGREVTVAGEMKGKRVLPLDEIDYTYPLISVKEIHLWPVKREERVYPYPYWHYPWWWYHP